jgi:ubiquinone/menaquinone biosynthesis C-methylase UbiE
LLPADADGTDRSQSVGLRFVCANAETLPFEDNSFDAYTIAFGLRNVTKARARRQTFLTRHCRWTSR